MRLFRRAITAAILAFCVFIALPSVSAQPTATHDLRFSALAAVWDEALPMGNGMLGALAWQKGGRIRLSLDRADLWDLRPMKGLERPEFRFDWVREQVAQEGIRDRAGVFRCSL